MSIATTTTTTTSSSSSSATNQDNLETFSLIWLDSSIHNSDDNLQTLEDLRAIMNHLVTFEDSDPCEEYIRSISCADRIVIIVSGHSGRRLVPRIHALPQVWSIYVYCMDRKINEQWTKNYAKVISLSLVIMNIDSKSFRSKLSLSNLRI